ncbi:response regulator, partial [candidate division KSB1 bacterium]|nr:response regulator [candidate division KSB1 bacterium]
MEESKGKILLVEDEEFDQLTFKRFAQKEYFPYQFQIAGSVSEARLLLRREPFDIIISDYMLGDGTIFDLLGIQDGVPFVLVTGASNEQIAVTAIKSGIQDYLI